MNKVWIILFLLGISLLTLRACFVSPDWVDVHDPTAIYRLSTLIESLRDGQFPAAWHNTLNYGYGYPLHLYYAPLFTYLAAGISTLGFGLVTASKLALTTVTVVGAAGAYYLMRRYGRLAAITTSIAFVMLPYHASALYVRGSYAEATAINLIPWVLYFWTNPIGSRRRIIGAAVTTALFLLSHNTTPFLLIPVIIICAAVFQRQYLRYAIASAVLALMLPAALLFPSLFERHFVQVEAIAKETHYADHFVALNQLWYSPWDYGGSAAGTDDRMSFMLGKGQIVLASLGVITALLRRSYKILWLGLPLLGYLILTNSISDFIWQLFPALAVLQFPWRTLGIATLGLSLFAGYWISTLPRLPRYALSLIVGILLITTNIKYFVPWSYASFGTEVVTSQDNLYPLVEHKIPEYLPIWMDEIMGPRASDGLTRTATRVSGNITQDASSPININTAYMPHWRLKVGDSTVPIEPDEHGLIRTVDEVGEGTHAVELTWSPTTLERVGYTISIVALIAVLGLAL